MSHHAQVVPVVQYGQPVRSIEDFEARCLAACLSNCELPRLKQEPQCLVTASEYPRHMILAVGASLQDLVGKKKVNFNTQGPAAAYSGPLIFSRLGINVEKTFIPHQVALEQMRKGEMAAESALASVCSGHVRGRFRVKRAPLTFLTSLQPVGPGAT
jgi:hypothetical protein